MSSKSSLAYGVRANGHLNPVVKNDKTVQGLKSLSEKHNFMIFEDRIFVDIGNTVHMQYHGGALRISEWAHIVNASVLAGDGIVEALIATGTSDKFDLATGAYTKACFESARKHKEFVVGSVATQALNKTESFTSGSEDEDFVVFTTGVNRATKGDPLGQQYQTPQSAIARGADFIISGRGIYGAEEPVETAKLYQKEGWEAYLQRIAGSYLKTRGHRCKKTLSVLLHFNTLKSASGSTVFCSSRNPFFMATMTDYFWI
ncbi:MAG: orotidine 5'-phosphate decarboxylase [Candelina submexicana]|nr:MAG: orotidine 5'-phosphate decarboxylase [Candelina submexicana]